jgi:hypothetical protein
MRMRLAIFTALSVVGIGACGSDPTPTEVSESVGDIEVALTNAPSDVSCVKVSVVGSRTDVRSFDLTTGKKASFSLSGLPVGVVSVSADAYPVACNKVSAGLDPSWYSEAVAARIQIGSIVHVALSMIHNGKASVGVDFDENNAPTQPGQPPLAACTTSSAKPYLVPVAPGVKVRAILTVGDSPNNKPDGTPYRMVGIPDGGGAFDNGDGTFTYLLNHEIPGNGVVRAHGAKGAFVSKWTVRKADLAVCHGEDLGTTEYVYNTATKAHETPATPQVLQRFCSADLPAGTAFFDVASGLGYDAPLFMNGEESGAESRAWAHDMTGGIWELPRLGKAPFENQVATPKPGKNTVVVGTEDDGVTNSQVYVYVGTKTNAGSPVDKAGLNNGKLYGLRVVGQPTESQANGIPTGPVELYEFGDVSDWTGAKLATESNTNLVTTFARTEDAAWDPNNPNDLYFVSTNSFSSPSRLWRVRFVDSQNPTLGGKIEMLLNGTEGHKMLDNIGFGKNGHIYLQEDVGNNAFLGRILRYDIATDSITPVLSADPTLFDASLASPTFQTQDEEASGVFDASALLGPGWFLTSFQNHKSAGTDLELVEGGQLMAFYDPGSLE